MKKTEICADLKRLGFTENSFVETILVSKNNDGSYNAAPMGVIRREDQLEIRVYKSSKTYNNLIDDTCVSLNITDDPILFLKTAFKDEYEEIPIVNDWYIQGSDAIVLARKKEETMISDFQSLFILQPFEVSIKRREPTVFSRGRAAAIEAIIHATRVKIFHLEKMEDKVNELLDKIDSCFNIILRTSDDSSAEKMVLNELKTLFNKWGLTVEA